MRKVLLVALITLNVVLGATVAAKLLQPREARAQPLGLSGNYLMVAGSIMGTTSDAVYVVDLTNRELLAMVYGRSSRDVEIKGRRSLARDLGLTEQPTEQKPGARTRRRY